MARRTFFSFHYKPDVNRTWVVRNSWVSQERVAAGFFDSSVFESKKREGDDVLKRFLREGLKGSSVTCVLPGTNTAYRRWVKYELVQSFRRGNGILSVAIHGIKNLAGQKATKGPDPLDRLAFTVDGNRVYFKTKHGDKWVRYSDAPGMPLADVAYNLGGRENHTFSTLFSSYEWKSDDGYNNLGKWIEKAARQAGR